MQSDSIIITPAVKYTKILPDGCALVLEGGGVRGFYSAGVFEAFMDAGIMFPYIIGVSAGAANALSYISGQRGRNRLIIENFLRDHKYLSYRNLITHGSFFGFDFIFKTIPEKFLFWDEKAFTTNKARFLSGATDCNTGETVWFEKQDIITGFDVIKASCSVPFFSKVVRHNSYCLLDGGISSPIPIEKSIADGNTFHVIVLTRNHGYIKSALRQKNIIKLLYGKYPKLIEAMLNRHDIYNKELSMCEQLEKDGKAIIIRPSIPLTVGRTDKDIKKILKLHDEGHTEGELAVKILLNKFHP